MSKMPQLFGEMKNQMGKLTNFVGLLQQEKGKLPPQHQANPQGQHAIGSSLVIFPEQAKAIITLRSGKAVDNSVVNPPVTPISKSSPELPIPILGESLKQAPEKEASVPLPQVSPVPAPYPHRLRMSAKPSLHTEI